MNYEVVGLVEVYNFYVDYFLFEIILKFQNFVGLKSPNQHITAGY